MLCAECQDLLSDYLDGDLAVGEKDAVDLHIRDCSRCASLRNDLARIIHASASLATHTPSPAVWEGIRREIAGGSVVAGPRAWWDRAGDRTYEISVSARQLIGAAAAVVVLVSAFVAYQTMRTNAAPTLAVSSTTAVSVPNAGSSYVLASVEGRHEVDELRAAVDSMATLVGSHRAAWSTELQTTFAKSVSDLDRRIAECDTAYAKTGTEQTRQPLLEALRWKLAFLDEFARVQSASQPHSN